VRRHGSRRLRSCDIKIAVPRAKRSSDFHPELGLPEVRKLWQTEGLFSDHYLKKRIQENSWWPNDAEAQPIFEFCKALYEKRYLACAKNNEAFTRQELLDKILENIGFPFSNNLGLPETQQDLEPDYILYPDKETKERVIDGSREERYRASVAILEAKKLNHPLSQISRHQQRYPHQQMRNYLNEAEVLTWGILTNGNEWRLYCRDTKPSHFFGINFELAIQSLANSKFCVALFSPAAFVKDAQNKCRLDYVRESALAAQSQLEEDLRKRVFALVEILANGFAERTENKITDPDLPRLYKNCLIFLYRLLFILYAEGRSLLPVEPKSRKYYKELSLARLISPLRNFSEFDSRTRTRLYEDIRELCHLINGTEEKKNAEYKVPQYNGGLFDPNRHPDLEQWRVSDAVLADVLRGLMFNPVPERGQAAFPAETVDFGDLRVQQLGSIYEGLMEHHFHRADKTLKLVADKAERRQTGTYYTPDYIVKYIVQNTVGRLLAVIEQREDVKAARSAGLKNNSFANAALELNILDPAMGSGHFLVEATTHLAEEIASHPTTKPLSEKSRDEDEIAYWRRRVVESCIYGVDLNPLAVELAKLSLWLTTIAADQPLDFLDHHLCCGNSLIGAQLKDLGYVPDLKRKKDAGLKLTWQLTDNLLAALEKAVRHVKQIEQRASQTVADVKGKEKIWSDSVRPALRPFRSVANLWLACFFGNDLPQPDYEALIELLDIHPDKIRSWKNVTEFQDIVIGAVEKGELKLAGRDFDKNQLKNVCAFLVRAEKTAHQRRFFHWELEFPEVFFNDDGTPREASGFDAVIGNPPYVNAIELNKILSKYEKPFWATRFESAAGAYDLYILFLEQIIRLSGPARLSSLIVPNKFLSAPYAESFREHCSRSTRLLRITDVSRLHVFDEPAIYPVITLVENSAPKQEYNIAIAKPTTTVLSECAVATHGSSTLLEFPESIWGPLLSDYLPLARRVQTISVPLDTRAGVQASSTAAEADAFEAGLTDTADPATKRFINTGLIDRYDSLWGYQPLTHKSRIFQTPYLDISNPIVPKERKEQYNKPKLIFAKIALRIEALLDGASVYASANTNFVHDCKISLSFLAGVLNSKLMWRIYSE